MAKGMSRVMQRRALILLAVVFFTGFSILAVRLFKLQLIDGDFYQSKAQRQQLTVTKIPAHRGTIFDCNMKVLAESATVWDVSLAPAYLKKGDTATRELIADHLSVILNMDKQAILDKLQKNTSYEVIAKKVEKPTADVIRQFKTDYGITCIGLAEDTRRYYPYGNFASQLLGFVGTDNQGLSGVESYYDSTLKGTPGKVVSAKNATGTDMPYDFEDTIPAKSGTNLVLTIDQVVQQYLEKNIQQAKVENNVGNRVTAIAMDVNTGGILGMATTSGFDPNTPYEITDPDTLNMLSTLSGNELKVATKNAQAAMWRNKAITDPYEPGSTFKVITSAAALDAHAVKADDSFFCGGSMTVGGRTIHCWKTTGHGSQTFIEGLENSCNVVFMTVGARLGSANFYKYFSSFGLTQKTGIDLPGEAGSITHPESDLGTVQLAVSSFGQSFKITPIELITAVSAVANGGKLVQPHVVKEMVDDSGKVVKNYDTVTKRQVVSPEIAKELCLMLEKEVTDGTGQNAYVAGYRVAGKTGTSQKLDKDGGKSLRIASFVGFAPADNPKVAVLMLMDEPHASNNYGGVIAAPVVGSIMSEILPYLNIKTQYTPQEQADMDIKAPDLSGKTIKEAQNELFNLGLKELVKGNGETVTGQVPAKGESIPKGGTVILYCGSAQVEQSVTVPNFANLSPEQVNVAAAQAGINVRYFGTPQTGTGIKAYEQDIGPGSNVPPGTVVTVKFRNVEIKDDD